MCSHAYFRWKSEADVFSYSFNLECKEIGVNRTFNFSRRISETIGDFQNRIRTNLEKTICKKRKKKLPDTKKISSDGIIINFKRNGEAIDSNAICKDVLYQGDAIMELFSKDYCIRVNVPWITALSLPDNILAGFLTYPSKLELEFADKKDCSFTWYKSNKLDIEISKQKKSEQMTWVEVGHDYYYTSSAEDIGCYIKLKCTPNFEGRSGPPVETVSSTSVQAGPGVCPFEVRHSFTREHLTDNRVVSYNILADMYADSDFSRDILYPYCPPYAIAIDYRKQLILKELIGYHADIICLQEVDTKVFDCDLLPVLGSLGYQGIYSKKGGQVTEGLACFFKDSRFVLLSSHNINLGEEIPSNPLFEEFNNAIKENEALMSRILDRGTILKEVVLKHKENGNIIIVGITHLYFHPDADHVRLLQAGACLRYLEHSLHEWQKKLNKKAALLFCGDFNSTPEFGVYRLMTQKHISSDYADWSSNEQEAVKGLSLSHNLHLESACGTPKYTNYTVGFADCLDYIFYQVDKLSVTEVIPLLSEDELKQHTALPSVVSPSDHVAIIADLTWLDA